MFDVDRLVEMVWLVPVLPLVGAVLTVLAGRILDRFVALPVIAGIGLSAAISLGILFGQDLSALGGGKGESVQLVCRWINLAGLDVPVEFRLDALSIAMIAMVTSVATLIAIFAAGYMADDPAQERFFAMVGLFVASMTGLVLSNNFVLTYAFWEGVGLCSYLLVGHYHDKPSAAAAAKKAFLVNRIGDVGFALAIFWMWSALGQSVRYDDVFAGLSTADHSTLVGIALLLFWAACAKSAQVPLYVWLPDAMEGPTPVSALIHAATMVTAGVYLVARASPLFVLVPEVQAVVAIIGCITALLAAAIAVSQYDLKRVLAYSTVSQLGYMFMALGAGVGNVAQAAVVAAMFHLITHAFFKALLFLGSGSVMHSMGGVIDMRRFGGLARSMPLTCLTFAIGALALAGFPLTAGFFSKDEILLSLKEASHAGVGYGWVYGVIYWTALFTAFLTAFYVGRAFCLTFLGPKKLPSPDDPEADPHEREAHDHGHGHHELGHESGPVMILPLLVLAVPALFAGWALGGTHLFADYLERTPRIAALPHGEHSVADPTTMGLGIAASLLGLGLSLALYRGGTAPVETPASRALRPLWGASYHKFWVDEFYDVAVVKPVQVLAQIAAIVDQILVEPLTRALALLPRLFGRAALARYQNGLVQSYAAASALGLAVLLIVLLWLNSP